MSDLTVMTVVENDAGLLDLMVESVKQFTNPCPKFVICDNGNNGNVLNKYVDDPNFTVIKHQPKMKGGSNRHGEGLNEAFKYINTSRFAIIESDCIVLKRDWDKVEFPKHKMMAAKKGSLAGQPYYHICFLVGSTRLLRHSIPIDFRPGQDNNRSNRNYKPHEDVGWQLRNYVRADQVKQLQFVDCKSGEGQHFNSSFQSDEFWLDGEAIVAHFGRGSNIGGKAIRKGFKHPKEQLKEWRKVASNIINAG